MMESGAGTPAKGPLAPIGGGGGKAPDDRLATILSPLRENSAKKRKNSKGILSDVQAASRHLANVNQDGAKNKNRPLNQQQQQSPLVSTQNSPANSRVSSPSIAKLKNKNNNNKQKTTPIRGSVIGGTFDANSLPAITPQSAHIETIDIPETFDDDGGGGGGGGENV